MAVIKCARSTKRITASVLSTFQVHHILFQSLHFPLSVSSWQIIKSPSKDKIFSLDREMLKNVSLYTKSLQDEDDVRLTSEEKKIKRSKE